MTDLTKREIQNLDIEELDDNEFEIPSVDALPTLESIMNEADEGSDESDFELEHSSSALAELLDETSSMGSIDSKGIKKPQVNLFKNIHGSILKHKNLRGVSSQLNTHQFGSPSALTVSTNFIVVGTFHGHILVFDLKQAFKMLLSNEDDFGSVSAIAVKQDNSRLICGYVRGNITFWNLQNGELIKTFDDLHGPQTAVLHLKFLSDPSYAILSDSSGSVFTLTLKKRDIESQCIFSGSRGEVLSLDPLHVPLKNKSELVEFSNICLLSMATVTKIVAMNIRPTICVHFTLPLKGKGDTLPLLAWQFVTIQVSQDSRVVEPVLTFARHDTVYFYQATLKSNSKVHFAPLLNIKLNYVIQSLNWLNSRTIVTIDTLEKIHLIDVRTEEELEILDIETVQLVYGSAHYKALATGGCVSPAMALAGERACFHSVALFNSMPSSTTSAQMLILGMSSVHLFTIRSWKERIDLFLSQNKFHEALSIALSFYEDKAKAVVGLTGTKSERCQKVADKIVEILNCYVDTGFTKLCPEQGKIEVLINYYRQMIPVCVEYSLAINNQELLFGKLYDKFSSDTISNSIFLECLEPYILDGRLTKLNPVIAKELVIHYTNRKYFQALEAIIIRLDVISLDIHLIMTLCWKHCLYDVIIYIHNQAFDDYITPLEELLNQLENAMLKNSKLTENEITLGNKLFVYISCSLTGRAYPRKGMIPDEKKARVRKDILNCITKFKKNGQELNSSTLFKASSSEKNSDTIYPYLKLLLNFDTSEFLNVLSMAFDDLDFDEDHNLVEQKQRIVDILLRIMVDNSGFSPSQIGILFIFLARQLAKPKNSILVNKMLFDQVVEFLTNPNDDSRFEERQQALLELIQAENVIQIEEEKILILAKKAKFYRICEFIYLRKKDWNNILLCYLNDVQRKVQVFSYINQIVFSPTIPREEKADFFNSVFLKIDKLTEINNFKTANLILDYIHEDKKVENLLKMIENQPKILYNLLYGFFASQKRHKKDASVSSIKLEGVREQRKQQLLGSSQIQEKFLELMCQFEPPSVVYYLKQLEGYRLDVVLPICRKFKVRDAMAFLLEKIGNYSEAYEILLEDLKKTFEKMMHKIEELATSNELFNEIQFDNFLNDVEKQFNLILGFCQRCSSKISETKEKEYFWFSLLDAVMNAQHSVKKSEACLVFERCRSHLKELTNRLLSGMIGNIDLSTLLQRILQDPLYNSDNNAKLSDIRELLINMLDNYNYQQTLLQTTNNLIENDLHKQLLNLTKNATKPHSSLSTSCSTCLQELIHDNDVVVFSCGHPFHSSCINFDNKKTVKCHICDVSCTTKTENAKLVRRISQSANYNEKTISFGKNSALSSSRLTDGQLFSINLLRKCQKVGSRLEVISQHPFSSQKFGSSSKDDFYQLKLDPDWKLPKS